MIRGVAKVGLTVQRIIQTQTYLNNNNVITMYYITEWNVVPHDYILYRKINKDFLKNFLRE